MELVLIFKIFLFFGFLIALFGAIGFLITGSYLRAQIPFSIGFINIPAFLIFIPITTFMARIGARTVHAIDKNKIGMFETERMKKMAIYRNKYLDYKSII